MRIVLDVENTVTYRHVLREKGEEKKLDILPFFGTNKLISVGVKDIDTGVKEYLFFNHKDLTDPLMEVESSQRLQEILDETTLMIGHNIKHDLIWMLSCGFKIKLRNYWDTMVVEYLLAKADLNAPFGLGAIAERFDLPRKKTGLIHSFEEDKLPPPEVFQEYGEGDLDTTHALFEHQSLRLLEKKNRSLAPTVTLMNEFMWVLTKWQYNGIKIDVEALKEVRKEYVAERDALRKKLQKIAQEAMGDTPINLASPDDRSLLLYSRRVTDKKEWKRVFNVGTDDGGKKKRRPRMSNSEFKQNVRNLTEVVKKTRASQCKECQGKGRVFALKKDNTVGKAKRICKSCGGSGVIYTSLSEVAGFKLLPEGVKDVAAAGFETSKGKLAYFAKRATDDKAIEFLNGMQRLNAINVYISTFCDGILNNVTKRNILHTNFNQTITATGRLSSSDPNFQNQPRGNTFPVRRAVISRFAGGLICDADYGQLEFRVAAALSGCEVALQDILAKVDVHARTRDILVKAGKIVDRQGAKSDTFKPLYGGEFGTEAEMEYYKWFAARYPGIAAWQNKCGDEVIAVGYLTLPSGRQYTWKKVYRDAKGRVQPRTQIVNYPVQGFATGDIVPMACVLYDREIEARNLKSLPFLTVHDSITTDVHPDEKDIIPTLKADCLLAVKQEMLRLYNYNFNVPLSVDVKMGENWLDAKEVLTKEHIYDKTVRSDTNVDEFHDDPLDDIGR